MRHTGPATAMAAAILLAHSMPASAQDAAAGERAFRKCAACHQVGPDATNRVGPHLNGILGREAAAVEGFRYSPAMRASDIIWDEEQLAAYLANPRQVVRGTTMAFAGIRNEQELRDLIAYLRQFE